jgi:hypothetical protein
LLLATFRVVILKYGLKNDNIASEVEKREIPKGYWTTCRISKISKW